MLSVEVFFDKFLKTSTKSFVKTIQPSHHSVQVAENTHTYKGVVVQSLE